MMTLLCACVVDASVAIKLFLVEAYTSEVQSYFLRLSDDVVMYAPDLLKTECANILWRQVTMNGYPPAEARRDFRDLLALAINWTPTPEVLPRAFEIAVQHGCTVYDACYVALAEQMAVPLVTHDNRLAHQLARNAPAAILTLDARLTRES